MNRLNATTKEKEGKKTTFLKIILYLCVCAYLVAQSCPTLCDPMDWSPSGSSVHGLPQARILEWAAISFSILQTTVIPTVYKNSLTD